MRTELTREPQKAVSDRAVLHSLLDEVLVAHVGLLTDDGPLVVPTAIARDGNRILIHGSTGSGWLRTLAAGTPASVAVTAVDGMVVARSAFESSVHYRSAVLFGTFSVVENEAKVEALQVLTDSLIPGRTAELRASSARELAATLVLQMPIGEWSLKRSDGWPDDPPEDVAGPAWAGVVPMRTVCGAALPAPDLGPGRVVPPSVRALVDAAPDGAAPADDAPPPIRKTVARVAALAPLPSEEAITPADLAELEQAVSELPEAVTVWEADALIELFEMRKADTYHGVMWAVVRAVESADRVPPEVWTRSGPWFDALRMRASAAGLHPPIGRLGRFFRGSAAKS